MSFLYASYTPIALLLIIAFLFFVWRKDQKFYQWIKDNWFLEPQKKVKYGQISYALFLLLIALSLLDLRGLTEYIETEIPDQRTIILLDQSASMLVEDVRPSRYERAITLARHFVRNAVGHRVAVVIFSDNQIRVVPFTNDIEMLDSRLNALRSVDIRSGGTNLSQALQETIKYFRTGGRDEFSDDENLMGNILLLTDAEEHEKGFPLKIPNGISLAVVGIGTVNGGKIPLRDQNNVFRGYKRYQGEEIVSKLDEEHMLFLASQASRNKTWILRPGLLPTDEIVDFFREGHRQNIQQGSVRIRPVLYEYLILPALLFYFISVLLGRGRILHYKRGLRGLILVFMLSPLFLFQDLATASPGQIELKLERLREGRLNPSEKLKLAEELARNNLLDEASALYQESHRHGKLDVESLINYGTTLLKQGNLPGGLSIFEEAMGSQEITAEQRELIRRNIFRAVEFQEPPPPDQRSQEDQDQDSEDQEQDQDQSQDQQDQSDEGESQDEADSQGQEQSDSDQRNQDQRQQGGFTNERQDREDETGEGDDQEDKEETGDDRDDRGAQDLEEGQQQDEQEDQQSEQQDPSPRETLEERELRIRDQLRQTQLPGVVEEILDRDREFQRRFLNSASTSDNRDRSRKDW